MNEVQANGEPKKIFLTKPTENLDVINEPTTSAPHSKSLRSWSVEHQVRIPPRRHMTPVDKYADEYLSNHKKQRYWNSWEELYLVELWRRYKDELTLINVPLPVYRKMMVAMRNRNMVVTAQDCRRKVNTLNNRYKQELLRVQTTGCKSEWRLYPLLHCVFEPKIKEFNPWHEIAIIKKLLDKIPKPEITIPVLNNIHSNNYYNNYQTAQSQNLPTMSLNNNSYQPRDAYQTSVHSANLSPAVNSDSSPPHNRLVKASILPFRNITMEKIEQLRHDNRLLAEERDTDLKRLHMEEANFACFEEFIRTWTEQKEIELQRIQLISVQSVISIENEGKQNVEQQLNETVVAK